MNIIAMMWKKFYGSIFLTSLMLTGILAIANQSALADYQPPPKPKNQPEKPTSGTIARGCPRIEPLTDAVTAQQINNTTTKAGLVALAPQVHHTGRTTTSHPTFVWHVPDSEPYQVSLELYQYQPEGQLQSVWTWESTTERGIMSVSLPPEQPPLAVDARYYWQVRVQCDPNYPSSWLIADANLEVVATPANLASQIAQNTDSETQAELYADAGIWYDALAIALQSPGTDRIDLRLIESLAQIEATAENSAKIQDPKELSKTHSHKLQQVIEAEQQQTISYKIVDSGSKSN